ncbi:MAG: hypothetical protein COZ32_05185 [Nitrospirae bacterium CG_4_10_14_3_um_filter_53_41]|nr:MAG: hypothetical protein AUK29_05815 [Nitrospirae bacterium CG2_30_53_67]PIW84879.1 MAG: hypothetical protein COZ95_07480 [Nitrospirae bacterium CG_4_8_14_3_um_filter_50_41]PIX86079.1 MAG: hypothetical protein COZ32_05185 [Nitrospirae bacterium CG_4_10_14_3_um_filter_53_41]
MKKTLLMMILSGMLISWTSQRLWHLPVPFTFDSEAAAEPSVKETGSEVYVIKDLPCFKCHIYERFVQEPAPGVFSHALHVQFEYHCNQCHSFSGHRQLIINTTLCTYCHEAVPELRKH